jgi:hypothetical protein
MSLLPNAERLFECVLAAVALELLVLLGLWYRRRAGWLAADASAQLCAAGMLVAAALVAQKHMGDELIALCLFAALLAHACALVLRWREVRASAGASAHSSCATQET